MGRKQKILCFFKYVQIQPNGIAFLKLKIIEKNVLRGIRR